MNHRTTIVSLAFALAAGGCGGGPSKPQEPQGLANDIQFAAGVEVPTATELPLLELSAQPVPADFVTKLLQESHPGLTLGTLHDNPLFAALKTRWSDGMRGVVESDHLLARVDTETGDSRIYPTLTRLERFSSDELGRLAERGKEILNSPVFIPPDDTKHVTEDEPEVLRSASWDGTGEPPTQGTPRLAYFSAHRFVQGLPVDGPGSRATLSLGHGAVVHGMLRSWKRANITASVPAGLSPDQVKDEIRRQLRKTRGPVSVDRIELAYYDAHKKYLQPVYRFSATLGRRRSPAVTSKQLVKPQRFGPMLPRFVVGYVHFGAKEFEPLPALDAEPARKPLRAKGDAKASDVPPPEAGDPIVGRYVVANDDPGWIADADGFWEALSGSESPTASAFTDQQYYFTEPRLFTDEKNTFINNMHLALIEAHGGWGFFDAGADCCDQLVDMRDVPTPGYGAAAGGRLVDWVIHSCEVIPSPEDANADWVLPWQTLFGGVRHVMGYRTPMYITDAAGAAYAESLAGGASVVNSWLDEVVSLNIYFGRPLIETHNVLRPYGRPAALSVCGLEGESVFSAHPVPTSNCLSVWWISDDGRRLHE